MSILGLGFIFGGLALIYKRINSFLQVFQFALMGFIVAPLEQFPLLKFLPASLGAYFLKNITVKDLSFYDFSFKSIVFLIAINLAYLFLGYVIYKLCEKKAMNEGTLGHY